MKYVLILPDGAADEPIAELDGQTALGAAKMPHINGIAASGRCGTVKTVPDGYIPGSDVATFQATPCGGLATRAIGTLAPPSSPRCG